MGWGHAARPPEPACPDGWRHAGSNGSVLTRASRRDQHPELTRILTPRNRGPTRRGQRASPGPIRTPLPNGHGHRNLLSQGVATTTRTQAIKFDRVPLHLHWLAARHGARELPAAARALALP